MLPPLEMSKVDGNTPALVGADLYEAICLRVDEETYRQIDSGIDLGEDGIPVTGDDIVDSWERELTRGIE
jgi:hypothetical protein